MNTSAPFSPLAFAAAVASCLGSSWSAALLHAGDNAFEVQRNTQPAKLCRADGLTLYVSRPIKGRVGVALLRPRDASGSYPSLWAGCNKVSDPLVTVNVTRSAEAAAKDLVRRLVPDAERVHALALAAVAQSDKYAEDCKRAEAARDAANKVLRVPETYVSTVGREVQFQARVAPEKAEAFARLVADFFRSPDFFRSQDFVRSA